MATAAVTIAAGTGSANQTSSATTAAGAGVPGAATSSITAGQNASSTAAAQNTSNRVASAREWINFTTGIGFGLVFGIVGVVYAQHSNALSKQNNGIEWQAFMLSVKEFCESESVNDEDRATCEAHDWELSLKYMLQNIPTKNVTPRRDFLSHAFAEDTYDLMWRKTLLAAAAFIVPTTTLVAYYLDVYWNTVRYWFKRPDTATTIANGKEYSRFRGAIFGFLWAISSHLILLLLLPVRRLAESDLNPLMISRLAHIVSFANFAIMSSLGAGVIPKVDCVVIQALLRIISLFVRPGEMCLNYAATALQRWEAFAALMRHAAEAQFAESSAPVQDNLSTPAKATGSNRESSAGIRYLPRRSSAESEL